jgi:hypothetical protein
MHPTRGNNLHQSQWGGAIGRHRGNHESHKERTLTMLYTIAVILVVLWLVGLVSSYTMGGFIHVLLVIAIVVVLVNIINGRKALG